MPFVGDIDSTVNSLGFIISVEKGLIAVPKKVARMGPSIIRITFNDGSITQGTVIYSDMITPFGIIMIDKEFLSKNKDKLSAIPLGSTKSRFAAGDQVALLGITLEGQQVIKTGHIINSNRNFANRYGAMFQSSFDHSSNLNGAPIFNDNNLCVGMHMLATEATSYDLKVEYISAYLAYYLDDKFDGKPYKRGDIGLSINLIVVGFEKTNYKLPPEVAEEIIKDEIPSGGPPELMTVSQIVPGFEAGKIIKPGDVIYKLDGRIMANDFLLYDEIINSKIGESLSISVYRSGQLLELTIPTVNDTNDFRINKYLLFAGAYFHDITPYARASLFTSEEGIYLTYSSPGSPFAQVSGQSTMMKNNYILISIDNTAIKSLDNLLEFLRRYCSSQTVLVKGIDLNILGQQKTEVPVDLPFASQTVVEFSFSFYGGWTSKSIDLSEYCKDRTEGFINKSDDPAFEQTINNNPSTVASSPEEKSLSEGSTTNGGSTSTSTTTPPSNTETTTTTPTTANTATTPAPKKLANASDNNENSIRGESSSTQKKKERKMKETLPVDNKGRVNQAKIAKIFFESNIKIN